MLKKEETIREIHTGCQESIARNEDDVKMIQNLEETVCRLRKEITVLNAKIASKNELIETLKRDIIVIKTKYRDVVTELTIQKTTNRKIYEEFSKRYDHLFATYGCRT